MSPWLEAAGVIESTARSLRLQHRVPPLDSEEDVPAFVESAGEQWLLEFARTPGSTTAIPTTAAAWILWRLDEAADFCRSHAQHPPHGLEMSVGGILQYALMW